jgi:hypothetical protein
MKTSIFRITCAVLALTFTCSVASKSQSALYDTEWENGKIKTQTKCVMGDAGFYEMKSISEYTYNEEGNIKMKEVFVWNKKYDWISKKNFWAPNYNQENWTPNYRFLFKEDKANNFITIEYFTWNKKTNSYNESSRKIMYQLNDAKDHFLYLALQKENKIDILVSGGSDNYLLAKILNKD